MTCWGVDCVLPKLENASVYNASVIVSAKIWTGDKLCNLTVSGADIIQIHIM